MNTEKTYYFSLLKQKIATTFLASHAASSDIRDWKGTTITDFQEDVRSKTNSSISEKWFYTYIKNDSEKLPRVDMLNLLSVYVGYENWLDFKQNHLEIEAETEGKVELNEKEETPKPSTKIMWLFLSLPLILYGLYSIYPKENTFSFCFIDADQRTSIQTIPLDITILRPEESLLYFKTDSLGCFSYTTAETTLKFVVKSPYHKTDTIVRHINSNHHKTFQLQTDDYALMLLYYANGNTKDWKKRRTQLQELIADNTQIYRAFKNNIGIEMYTKKEFINLLTIPTSSLKKMRILDKVYSDDKIVKLKFMIQ